MAFVLARPVRLAITVFVALVLIFSVWFVLQIVALGGQGREVIVTVHSGESLSAVASEMHAKGVINSPLAFRLDTMIFGGLQVQSGSYEIRQNSSFSQVRRIFGSAPNVVVIAVTPGLTLHEIALEVANGMGTTYANQFLSATKAAAAASAYQPSGSLEGLVGIGDYIVAPSESPSMLVAKMTDSFAKEAASVGLTSSTTLNSLNAYQLVIAASIVEKEGYYPKNMPKVARVIFNRLQRGGPLQMDATVLYYFNQDGGTVTPAMLATHTPYNTYLNSGLTPTPICSVSTIALNAVLHAPPGPWLYFTLVSKDGTEAFSSTFAEQLANERLAASRGIG